MDLTKYIGLKIKELRESRGMNQEQFAESLETTKQTISRYEKGDRKANQDILFKLSEVFNIDIDYFFPKKEESTAVREPSYHYFPESISAGFPLRVDGVTDAGQIQIPDSVLGKWSGDKEIFVTRVNGDSMNKIIPDKSLIAVKPVELHQIKSGDIVVYSDGGDYSVKRFYQDEDNIIFRPDSHDMSFYDYVTSINNDDLVIHGKVVVYIVELD